MYKHNIVEVCTVIDPNRYREHSTEKPTVSSKVSRVFDIID